jgi:hypothetical protein
MVGLKKYFMLEQAVHSDRGGNEGRGLSRSSPNMGMANTEREVSRSDFTQAGRLQQKV